MLTVCHRTFSWQIRHLSDQFHYLTGQICIGNYIDQTSLLENVQTRCLTYHKPCVCVVRLLSLAVPASIVTLYYIIPLLSLKNVVTFTNLLPSVRTCTHHMSCDFTSCHVTQGFMKLSFCLLRLKNTEQEQFELWTKDHPQERLLEVG